MLKHKGYYSEPKYSREDELFFGTIEGIDDLITFEAENASDLKQEFLEAVEDYLITCKEMGKSPDRPYSGDIRLRMGEPLHKQAAMAAFEAGESLNSYILQTLTDALTKKTRSLA